MNNIYVDAQRKGTGERGEDDPGENERGEVEDEEECGDEAHAQGQGRARGGCGDSDMLVRARRVRRLG